MAKQFLAEPCPICNSGTLAPYSDGEYRLAHKRKERILSTLHYSICDSCGLRGVSEEQAEENIRLIEAFEESFKDYISPDDIRRIRDKYRITQAEAGDIFGCGKSYFSKWENGEIAPTGSAAVLLKNALKHIDFMQHLAKDACVVISVPPKKSEAKHASTDDAIALYLRTMLANQGSLVNVQAMNPAMAGRVRLSTKLRHGQDVPDQIPENIVYGDFGQVSHPPITANITPMHRKTH